MDHHPTQEELEVLKNQRFLIVKQHLSDKIISHLASIERRLHKEIKSSDFNFPKGTFLRSGKISKGENYQSLPYFLLDYPRMFTKTDVFAFRSMLWWGNEFSCTLHMAGTPLARFKDKIISELTGDNEMFFCVHDNPWEYHFEPSNYLPVNQLSGKNIKNHIESHDFIKISNKISLDKWDQFGDFTLFSFRRFLNMLE